MKMSVRIGSNPMRKILEHHAFEKVGYFQSILESEGIQTLLKMKLSVRLRGLFGGAALILNYG